MVDVVDDTILVLIYASGEVRCVYCPTSNYR